MSFPQANNLNFLEIIQRIKKILNVKSDKDVANSIGMNPNSFFNRKKRGTIPMTEIVLFANTHNVNLEWLINGNEPIYKNQFKEASDKKNIMPLDPAIKILHEALEETGVEINEKQKQACLKILREELGKSDNKTKDDIKKYLKAFGE